MRMNQEVVSVIIPIYNVEPYLEMCIDSVVKQTYTNLEIILVDDGSTDGSSTIAERYGEADKRIRIIHQMNMGLSAARNVGIRHSTGRYVYLLDSDDMLHVHAIESMVYSMQEVQGDIVISNFRYIDSEENPMRDKDLDSLILDYEGKKRIISGRDFLLEIGNMLNVVAWGKLYKREVFDGIEYPVGKLHEDQYVTYKILYPLKKVIILEDKYYYYRKRNDSITAQKNIERRLKDTLAAYEEEIAFFKDKSEFELLAYSLKDKVNCLRKLVDIADNAHEKLENKKRLEEEYKFIKKYYQKYINRHIRPLKHKVALRLFFTNYRLHDLLWRLLVKIEGDS